jgi:hypothetical protein
MALVPGTRLGPFEVVAQYPFFGIEEKRTKAATLKKGED